MMLLDDTSPHAVVVDPLVPASLATLREALTAAWPRLTGRIEFVRGGIHEFELSSTDLVVSSHACGGLTDEILESAASARARVAVLPCCHDYNTCDAVPLAGWLDPALAIDVLRATRLESRGYKVWTQTIPAEVTPKNRLLLGVPKPPAV